VTDGPSLDERLIVAGVEPGTDPLTQWHRLHAVEGPRATVIDLYALVAGPRGLAPHELSLSERTALARSVMPLVWPGWAITADSERGGDVIEVVEYDAEWPLRYESWRQPIHAALGDTARAIEHVGSTSVPGLPAKPIVDIQISVVDLDDEARYVAALETLGVQLRSRDELHRYFRPFPDRPRAVHVHVCAAGSPWEHEHLLFRDYLRTDADARAAYAAAKREAAFLWSDDGWAYTDAKSQVISTIMTAAAYAGSYEHGVERVNNQPPVAEAGEM
jgi:GrpB-like predicted nucleotidyltransferase (UPF0157 family)